MREVAIIGAGIHKFGRFENETFEQIGQTAVRMALQDANITMKDIQMAYLAELYLPGTSAPRILKPMGAMGFPMCDVEAACASGGVALNQGVLGIQSGQFDIVLAFGVEKMPRGFMDPAMIYDRWQVLTGMDTNPSYWAMRARRHMHDYGTTDLHIAKVAHKNHKNSVHNPYAMYQKEFSIEEILNSRLVCDPIRLLEICAPDEGAAAMILCAKDKAAKYTNKPITIAASAFTTARYASDLRSPLDSYSAKVSYPGPTEVTAKKAFEQAGIGGKEISCFEVQDTDAFCEIEIYEELGLCPVGDAKVLIDEGATQINGKYPVNMSGGLISKGEPIGASHLGQVFELVTQLRGSAGPRQVKGAKVGLAHVLGSAGNCAITILKK